MDFNALMKELLISNPPSSWQRNYHSAMLTLEDNVLPSKEKLKELKALYGMPDEQLEQLLSCRQLIASEPSYLMLWHLWYTVLFVAQDCDNEVWSLWPKPESIEEGLFGVFRALLMLSHTDNMIEIVKSRGIDKKYIRDNMDSFLQITHKIHGINGYYGVSNEKMWWQRIFMLGKIYRLGRLQFEINRFSNQYSIYVNKSGDSIPLCNDNQKRYNEEGLQSAVGIYHPHLLESPLKIYGYGYDEEGYFVPQKVTLDRKEWKKALYPGDYVLSVHIPADGKLTPESVLSSMEEAKDFYGRYFKDMHFKAFICHTWLFNTQLKHFLPPESNILAFQKFFRIIMAGVDHNCLFTYIFDKPKCDLDELVPKNSFQKKVLDHVKNGGSLYDGFGYRLI